MITNSPHMKHLVHFVTVLALATSARAAPTTTPSPSSAPTTTSQWVEGFDRIEFHHASEAAAPVRVISAAPRAAT
jgi:hypothetical protein